MKCSDAEALLFRENKEKKVMQLLHDQGWTSEGQLPVPVRYTVPKINLDRVEFLFKVSEVSLFHGKPIALEDNSPVMPLHSSRTQC